jgi:hypothetical protein
MLRFANQQSIEIAMVPELVRKDMIGKVKMNWKEYQEKLRLCQECGRKHTAEALGLIASKQK